MVDIKFHDDSCAIFVHAGAGHHSIENQHKHLDACSKAARAGMAFLKNGSSSVDATEVALMILEDAPITNAGYGSNLNEKGVVEGDATIVDHRGRSGAAGAVPNVKNPIMLARRIYDHSNVSLSLQQVPPNFLVGQGAKDFAWNHGVVVVPDGAMISPTSMGRWKIWTQEIARWEREHPNIDKGETDPWIRRPLTPLSTRLERAGLPGFPCDFQIEPESELLNKETKIASNEVDSDSSSSSRMKDGKSLDGDLPKRQSASREKVQHSEDTSANPMQSAKPTPESRHTSNTQPPSDEVDMVTDTVGVIAIDQYGNIAAGSSSGGIGMKPAGRVGPAALLGIGTYVIPVDPYDPEQTSVAVVTSGTGEHIATTLAASTCANRIYYSQRKAEGCKFDRTTEEEAITSMIKNEFLDHPTVGDSNIFGAIGIMAVKKTEDSIAFYFAHNTDSFAIASMSMKDSKPACVMSRTKRRGIIAQGGSMIRLK
ncbi:hypothetical protein NUU61_007840 [Penicillium alfredii]|uniref:Asparaginase n=1 Tax=Penicillium alfredii TaxID=1506179 RepID=A0A9W9JYQ1_9EURO|nr:uncharacterized protein NUU61_007840 [Penicillium alfredii]KAJ5086533.1 hypothetical protein NUU61_007840 [Penicillium alfredii]